MSSRGTRILAGIGALAVAGVVALVVARVFFFSFYKVPAGSMIPTLRVGARASVRKGKPPERGAVMVFRYPEHREQEFIKRVVALPGEKLEVRSERVFINGWEVPRCELGAWEFEEPTFDEHHAGKLWMEYLGTRTYLVFHDAAALHADAQGPFHVKEREYFVLGDNRENSHDSRMWFGGEGGGVPADDFVGRVLAVDTPALPPGAEKLQAAFDACLAKRPAKTEP